jgi:hypothetical protein
VSRIITSPVKRWSGTVTLADPLTFPQTFAFEDAIDAVQAARRDLPEDAQMTDRDARRINYAALPGIVACVEEWHLAGFPEVVTIESFPATPSNSAARLIAWLFNEITQAFREAETVPNE